MRSNLGCILVSGFPLADDHEADDVWRRKLSGELNMGGVAGPSKPNDDDIEETRERDAISGEDRIGGVIPVMQSMTRTLGVALLLFLFSGASVSVEVDTARVFSSDSISSRP